MPEAPYSLSGYPRNQEELSPPGMPLSWIEINRGYERMLPRLADADRPDVEGYVTPMSAVPGETVSVHASSRCGRLYVRAYRESAAATCALELPLGDPGVQPIAEGADRNGAGWPSWQTGEGQAL